MRDLARGGKEDTQFATKPHFKSRNKSLNSVLGETWKAYN